MKNLLKTAKRKVSCKLFRESESPQPVTFLSAASAPFICCDKKIPPSYDVSRSIDLSSQPRGALIYVDGRKFRRSGCEPCGIFCHGRHRALGYQGQELDLCDSGGQHRKRRKGGPNRSLMQPCNSVNFIELLSRFSAFAPS